MSLQLRAGSLVGFVNLVDIDLDSIVGLVLIELNEVNGLSGLRELSDNN